MLRFYSMVNIWFKTTRDCGYLALAMEIVFYKRGLALITR